MSSIFSDKNQIPSEQDLSAVLGNSKSVLDKINDFISKEFGPITHEWKHYGKSSGWTLKTLVKKRNLFFISPRDGWFLIGFVFGDKAVAEVVNSMLPQDIIDEFVNARKYAEGRGIGIDVKSEDQYNTLETLIRIKVSN